MFYDAHGTIDPVSAARIGEPDIVIGEDAASRHGVEQAKRAGAKQRCVAVRDQRILAFADGLEQGACRVVR